MFEIQFISFSSVSSLGYPCTHTPHTTNNTIDLFCVCFCFVYLSCECCDSFRFSWFVIGNVCLLMWSSLLIALSNEFTCAFCVLCITCDYRMTMIGRFIFFFFFLLSLFFISLMLMLQLQLLLLFFTTVIMTVDCRFVYKIRIRFQITNAYTLANVLCLIWYLINISGWPIHHGITFNSFLIRSSFLSSFVFIRFEDIYFFFLLLFVSWFLFHLNLISIHSMLNDSTSYFVHLAIFRCSFL